MLLALPHDLLHLILAYLHPRDIVTLSTCCTQLQSFVNALPWVWRHMRIDMAPYGPYAHLTYPPYKALRAHAPHITRVTFGTYGAPYTRVTHLDLLILSTCAPQLEELHLHVPATHIAATAAHVNTLLQACPRLQKLTLPHKLINDDELTHLMPYTTCRTPVQVLTLHGAAPRTVRIRPNLLFALQPHALHTLKLRDVDNLDIEFLLRAFPRLATLSVHRCSTRRDNIVYDLTPWLLLARSLTKISVFHSKRVLPSLRPLIVLLMESSERVLPMQAIGGDWDDRTFMNLVSLVTCLQCVRTPGKPHFTVTALCDRCIAHLPPHLANLRRFKTFFGQA